jgi:hypothetical protein
VAIAADGPTEVMLTGGEACEVTLGADALSGVYGPYGIEGSRNFFTSKDKAEQGVANGILSRWLGPVNVIGDGGIITATIAKNGKVSVKGTVLSGKVSAKAVFLVGEKWCCVPVVAPKNGLAFNIWLSRDSDKAAIPDVANALVGKAGQLEGGARFRVNVFDELWSHVAGSVLTDYLPDGMKVTQIGTKWVLPKAGKVAYVRGGTNVDAAKLGENPSALKLTYKAKAGSFKGSFKVYADIGGKLKATTVNVVGVVVNGAGYGTATVKKVGSVSVSIE